MIPVIVTVVITIAVPVAAVIVIMVSVVPMPAVTVMTAGRDGQQKCERCDLTERATPLVPIRHEPWIAVVRDRSRLIRGVYAKRDVPPLIVGFARIP